MKGGLLHHKSKHSKKDIDLHNYFPQFSRIQLEMSSFCGKPARNSDLEKKRKEVQFGGRKESGMEWKNIEKEKCFFFFYRLYE